MVDIYPFKALHFSERLKKDISMLVSPPYDIISDTMKEELKTSDINNIVNLILPEEKEYADRYENADILLNSMIKDNILEYDTDESLYIFEESFYDDGVWKKFKAFIGLNKIEEYESSKVLRHEYTLSKPKEDRYNLLKHTKTNFGLIYTLYDDVDNKIQEIIDRSTFGKPFYDFDAGYDSTLKFRIWKLSDKNIIEKIINLMKDKNILIADGHHRYETSRLFMHEIRKKRQSNELNTGKIFIETTGDHIFPEEAVLTLFVNYNQESIKILPTHRMIKFKEKFNLLRNFEKINKYFLVKEYFEIFKAKPEFDNYQILTKNISELMDKEKKEKKHTFCIFTADKKIYFITLNKDIKKIYPEIGKESLDFENLDVRILHRLLIDNIMSTDAAEKITYTHTIDELVSKVVFGSDEYDLGIILNAPDISDVQKISYNGKVMPQKSTYFYPKPCSGLIIYKMDL
ncbi:MAG: DUF1015 domain-containing protein [Actinomycetota bacterium]|nr:DUF1015 domain-containing protein [Actinomycetota bacterium]